METTAPDDLLTPEELEAPRRLVRLLQDRLNSVLLGQETLIEGILTGFLSRGHVLLEGLPGLGKTELVKALARLVRLTFRRIQFTPDLLPSDVLGSPILQEDENRRRIFVFQQGPVFGNIILADEINRASPKTQAALLEAMQEGRATVMGETHDLPRPFYVLATQNPIELEGTYPLPEAQLDRFLLKLQVPGIRHDVLTRIVSTRKRGAPPDLEPVIDGDTLADLFRTLERIHLHPAVAEYIGRVVEATHADSELAPPDVRTHVRYGASPRGAIALGITARALAFLRGKPTVGFEEIRDIAVPALAHRLVLEHTARIEKKDAPSIIRAVIAHVREIADDLPPGVEGERKKA